MSDVIARYVPEISHLLEERLNVKGGSLDQKIGRLGRKLPKPLKRDLERLSEYETLAETPKLAMQIDERDARKRARRVIDHLKDIDPRKEMIDRILLTTAKYAAVLIVLFILAVWIARTRGLV